MASVRSIALRLPMGATCTSGLLCWIEQHQGLAAWVQAISAIIAIAVAIWVPARQAYNARVAADRERSLKAKSMATAIYPSLIELRHRMEAVIDGWAKFSPLVTPTHIQYTPGMAEPLTVELPPILESGVEEFYVLGEPAAPDVLFLLSLVRNYQRTFSEGLQNRIPLDKGTFTPSAQQCVDAAVEALKSVAKILGTTPPK